MLLTQYLDSIANTQDEARFLQELEKIKGPFSQMSQVPLVGKMFTALAALGECESIEGFKESCHYGSLEGWDIYVNLDSGMFSIYPGPEQRKKLFKILGIAAAGLLVLGLLCSHMKNHRD